MKLVKVSFESLQSEMHKPMDRTSLAGGEGRGSVCRLFGDLALKGMMAMHQLLQSRAQ